jgi:pyrroline-5-carboxylate reductase
VYRIAVNPAAAIQRGVLLLAEAASHDADDAVRSLLGRLGRVIVLDDALIDTAASVMRGTAADVEAHAADPGARAALERFAKLMSVSH